jgi:hypothetical protein
VSPVGNRPANVNAAHLGSANLKRGFLHHFLLARISIARMTGSLKFLGWLQKCSSLQ